MLWTKEMLGKLSVADVRSIAGNAHIASVGPKAVVINRIISQAPNMGQTPVLFEDVYMPTCDACDCDYASEDKVTGPGGTLHLCADCASILREALDKLGIPCR